MAWDTTNIKEWNWKQHPPGSVIKDAGSSRQFKTGGWRTFRPVRDEEKCSQCLICYVFCPDSSIQASGDKITGIDYDFCKGCGICAYECPRKAIQMVDNVS